MNFDAIVIGTGFAGAVTACRLVQAGLRICVLERGRRYGPEDFPVYPAESPGPSTNGGGEERQEYVQPDFSRLFWRMGQGLWDVRDLGDVVAAQAAGYGGGSLIYANVHLRAPSEVFEEGWPREYRRESLDPYYDLAAYMLDAKPIPFLPPKTAQLKRAAENLERDGEFFLPPLAVNFGEPTEGHETTRLDEPLRKNRWGRKQGTCDLRGDCCFGCQKQAKNTLDLNYLAIAEDDPRKLAEIETLCEVVSIHSIASGGYRVKYRDHLVGGSRKTKNVTGRYVFLCTGAINTTELLLRCRRKKYLSLNGRGLGENYHPNADALAVVFDCDAPQEADRGPTIGGAVLYSREERNRTEGEARGRQDWVLIQDGGIPEVLEPLLGVFRSPLWGGRNRYREVPPEKLSRRQPPPYARLPIDGVTDVFSGLTRSAVGSSLPLAHGVSEQLLAITHEGLRGEWPPEDRQLRRWRLLPNQLREALGVHRDELLDRFADAAEPLVDEFLAKTATHIDDRYDIEGDLLRSFPLPGVEISGLKKLAIPRRALELAVQLIWGSEGELIRQISAELLERLLSEPRGLARRAADLLRWALDYRLADGHTALLLCMGRDSQPGRLSLARSPGRGTSSLRASLPSSTGSPERVVQEQLLRDLAGTHASQGELRTDPAWSFLGKRLTVHSQGGCPMGSEQSAAVTGVDGQVHGCPGLYVMDAAAFPTPVGVNPSATIAAIAEYKIERFIQGHVQEGWSAPEMEPARNWANRSLLDPIGGIDTAAIEPPGHKPLGIQFQEVMKGFHAEPERWKVRAGGEFRFRADVLRKIAVGKVETKLRAEIEDLSRFLELHRRGLPQRIPLGGSLNLTGIEEIPPESWIALCDECPERSHLELLTRSRHRDTRHLIYRLHFHIDLEPWLLEGKKFLRDDARLDLWEDATTLFFEIKRGDPPVVFRRGILRTPASEFFSVQLPSFEVTNTEDPTRQSWALAAFGRFFFGHLVNVYVPELNRVVDVVKSIANRTHV